MENQPFDLYKDEVNYDYILDASIKLDNANKYINEISNLLNNEDLLYIYFDNVGLGRVYGKVEPSDDGLLLKFGISLKDIDKIPAVEDLVKSVNSFTLSLSKNLEDKPDISGGEVKVENLTKNDLDNIDKILVSENHIKFTNGTNVKDFILTEDGTVEKYSNNLLENTFGFSKLGVSRECKSLVANGYTLTRIYEANIPSTNDENDKNRVNLDLSNIEQTKKDLKQDIQDIDDVTKLKDELDDKISNLMEEDIKPTEPFPSTEFTEEPMLEQNIDVDVFNNELTAEQKAFINTYLGTIDDLVNAMYLLYIEVGDGSPMISLDDYIDELLKYDGGIEEWSQELSDMLGFELKKENKSKFYTAENMFDDFLKTAKEESDENGYTFKLSDLGLTREDSAEFKNLLLQRQEIDDIEYDPQNNTYTVKVKDIKIEDNVEDNSSDLNNQQE